MAHIEGGLKLGQHAARNAIRSMLSSVEEHFKGDYTINEQTLLSIANPLHVVKEICPEIKIRGYNINDYKRQFNSPVFFDNTWRNASDNAISDGSIGQISYHRLNLCSLVDLHSRSVAKTRCSAIVSCIMRDSEDLKSKLSKINDALGGKK